MKVPNSQWQFAAAHSSQSISSPAAFRFGALGNHADTPISQQVLSWLLFWPLLTLIARQAVYFSGPSASFEAGQYGAAMAGARGSHYYLYVYLLFLLGFVLAGHRQVWAVIKKNPLIAAILVVAASSAFWSGSPIITLQMSIQVGLCTLFACYLSARYTTERLMQLLMFMGVAAALLSVLFALALPSYGMLQGKAGGEWQGICNHKNSLGLSMAFLLTPVFFINSYGRGRKVLYSTLLLFLIYKSQSRGAWFCTGGMLLFVGWLAMVRRLRYRELTLLLILTATVGTAITVAGLHFWPLLAASMGKDPSMTGRTGIYAEVWRSILKHPMLGYGFDTFWLPGNPESQRICMAVRWPNIGYAENGILELALQTGFLGVGLVIAMIAKAGVQGARVLRSPQYSPRVGWFLTILFLAALTNIDAGWFLTSDTLDWVLILISCICMNKEMNGVQASASA
jgi:exopolysaccharide production protein ExoQ